jgi:hypothetical protein
VCGISGECKVCDRCVELDMGWDTGWDTGEIWGVYVSSVIYTVREGNDIGDVLEVNGG